MKKRAQVTTFMIAGIMIVFLVSIMMFLPNQYGKDYENNLKGDFDLLPVTIFVETCLENSLMDAADAVSYKGGYHQTPNESVIISYGSEVPYYFKENVMIPDSNLIRSELSGYTLELFNSCLNDFEALTSKGYHIELLDREDVYLSIKDFKIEAKARVPIEIRVNNRSQRKEEFVATIAHPLGDLHKKSIEVMDLVMQDVAFIPASELIVFASEKDVYVSMLNMNNRDVVYSIIRNKDKTTEKVFSFAVKHAEV